MNKAISLERVRYYPRQLMTADDMRAEQEYFLERMRRHNRFLHGWGIVCGLSVKPAATAEKPWRVVVCPGFALSPEGDEIYVPVEVPFDLARPSSTEEPCTPCPCPPAEAPVAADGGSKVFLAIRFVSRNARPIRVGHGDCGCSNAACEVSRLRDDFELAVLSSLPAPYDEASRDAEASRLNQLAESTASTLGRAFDLPITSCISGKVEPWIILTGIQGPIEGTPPSGLQKALSLTEWRRLVPRAQDLLALE
jgi:hypothetical protein